MPRFNGNLTQQDFIGTGAANDSVRYHLLATTGVFVDVTGGNLPFVDVDEDGNDDNGDVAAGDTYVDIDRFTLGDVADVRDDFIGSAADEFVNGYAGLNVIDGAGGNDTLTGSVDGSRNILIGGSGRDELIGGNSRDRFDVAAGDGELGEIYRGNDGDDTVRVVAGGTGSEIDLSGADLLSIEFIEFTADATLIVNGDDIDNEVVTGTAANSGEIVEVADWTDLGGNVDFDVAFNLLVQDIDEVRWEIGNDIGSVSLVEQVRDSETGEIEYVETRTADGIDGDLSAYVTLQNFYNEFFELFQTIVVTEDNQGRQLQTISEIDTETGAVLEQTLTDLTDDRPWEIRFLTFDANGNEDFRQTLFDNGLERQEVSVDGVKTFQFDTDLDDVYTYDTVEEMYQDDGNGGTFVSYRLTLNDATETFSRVEQFFSAEGVLEREIATRANNGLVVTDGNETDQVFVATSDNKVFDGNGGEDVFVFSGDAGNNVIRDFDIDGADLLDLTAYGIDSRTALETAGALSYNAVSEEFVIDLSQIGGTGQITLRNMQDGDLTDTDFILI